MGIWILHDLGNDFPKIIMKEYIINPFLILDNLEKAMIKYL